MLVDAAGAQYVSGRGAGYLCLSWVIGRMFRAVLVVFLTCALKCQVSAAFWDVELVYNGGMGSGDCALAFDSQGVPHISYSAEGTLYHAVKTLTGWEAEPIQSVGYWGGMSSITFDSSDRPCVAFVDSTNPVTNYLCFARKGAIWSIEQVAEIGWWADHVSLTVSPASQPCIAFCRTIGSNAFLSLARRVAQNQWSVENIAPVGSVIGPSLAFTASGIAFVAFVDSDSGTLKVARNNGSGWTIDAVDGGDGQFAVSYPSLAITPTGHPIVAYFLSSGSSSALKLASYSGSSWEKQTVAYFAVPVYSGHCASFMTSSGMFVVAYQDPGTGHLKGAWQIVSSWVSEEIDSAPMSGVRPSLRYGSGDLYLCYFDGFEFNVKLARAAVPLTLQQAKSNPDGSLVEISWLVASNSSQDFVRTIYAQSLNRTSGIKLHFTSNTPSVSRGDLLDVRGVLSTIDGERALVDPIIKVF